MLFYWGTFICCVLMITEVLSYSNSLELVTNPFWKVSVDGSKAIAHTKEQYVGFNLDGEWLQYMDILLTEQMHTLVEGIGSTYLRVGGTSEDYLIYNVGSHAVKNCSDPPYPMTSYRCELVEMDHFEKLFKFVTSNNLKLIFGLNDMFGRPTKLNPEKNICSGTSCPAWDSSNAADLLQWIQKKGYSVYAFELGNELDKVLAGKVGAQAQAKDMLTLKNLIQRIWGDAVDRPKVFGPDAHSWIMFNDKDKSSESSKWISMLWFQEFVHNVCDVVDGITYHMYIGAPDKASLSNFTTPAFLDREYTGASKILQAIQNACGPKSKLLSEVWVGETASGNKGGIPGASDRFVDIFWYVDQLGTLAKLGHSGFLRQHLLQTTKDGYGLVELVDGKVRPNPDYYIALLFKKLMGNSVLSTKVYGIDSDNLRSYAHCSTEPGKISVALINLADQQQQIVLDGDVDLSDTRKEWHLTDISAGLAGRTIELNGKLLKLNGNTIPNLSPKVVSAGSKLYIEARSVVFLEVPTSSVTCAKSLVH